MGSGSLTPDAFSKAILSATCEADVKPFEPGSTVTPERPTKDVADSAHGVPQIGLRDVSSHAPC